jgi:hypothetical protein
MFSSINGKFLASFVRFASYHSITLSIGSLYYSSYKKVSDKDTEIILYWNN